MRPDKIINEINSFNDTIVKKVSDGNYKVINYLLYEKFPCVFDEGIICVFSYRDHNIVSKIEQTYTIGTRFSDPKQFEAEFGVPPFKVPRFYHCPETIEEIADDLLISLKTDYQINSEEGIGEKITSTIRPPRILVNKLPTYRVHSLNLVETLSKVNPMPQGSIMPDLIKEIIKYFDDILGPNMLRTENLPRPIIQDSIPL